jgi:hypothetical protein
VHQRVKDVKDCYANSAAEKKANGGSTKSSKGKAKGANGHSATVAERGTVSSFPEQVVREGENKNWRQLAAGFYRNAEGVAFKVKISGRTGLPYASVETIGGAGGNARYTFEYAPGEIRKLTKEMYVGERLPREKKDKGTPYNEPVPGSVPESGMYRLRGADGAEEILKVYKAVHGSGNMVAKLMTVVSPALLDPDGKLVRNEDGTITEPAVIDWQYLGLAQLTDAGGLYVRARDTGTVYTGHVKVTLEEAKDWGEIYGVCMRCGKTLTLEASIAASLGTTCIKYFQAA